MYTLIFINFDLCDALLKSHSKYSFQGSIDLSPA